MGTLVNFFSTAMKKMKKIIKHDIAINKNCNYLPDCIQNFRKNASRTRLLTKWSAFCEEGDLGLTARLAIIVNQVKRVQKMKKNDKKWHKNDKFKCINIVYFLCLNLTSLDHYR